MRIILQGGDNMLGRAVQLTLQYQTFNSEDITDTQTAKDYLYDIFNKTDDIGQIQKANEDGSYLWGDLLELDMQEDLRIINIEAAPTLTINNYDIPNKAIHYHTNIKNFPGIFSKFIYPHIFCLANNHSMDMGRSALINETLPNIKNIVGAGSNAYSAYSPKIINNKLLLFAFGAGCSGIPNYWMATDNRAGVAYLPPIINEDNVIIAFNIIRSSYIETLNHNPNILNDHCIIISIHWGPNWSTENDGQIYRKQLAHMLIDELNVSIIHGHSSHHIRGIELYNNRLIVYGAGDFINDYEKIEHSGRYNTDGGLFIIDIDESHDFKSLQLVPFTINKLQCKIINDHDRIKQLIKFINTQSLQDCDHPLMLQL